MMIDVLAASPCLLSYEGGPTKTKGGGRRKSEAKSVGSTTGTLSYLLHTISMLLKDFI
jgi:hypothetical protein